MKAEVLPFRGPLLRAWEGGLLTTLESRFVATMKITDWIRYGTSSSPSESDSFSYFQIFKTNNSSEEGRGSIKTRVKMSSDKFKNEKLRDRSIDYKAMFSYKLLRIRNIFRSPHFTFLLWVHVRSYCTIEYIGKFLKV